LWSWLPPAKAKLTDQSLTLTNPEVHIVALFQVMAEKLSIPHILGIAKRPGRTAKILGDRFPSAHIQGRRSAWTSTFLKSGKSTLFKTLHPILDRPTSPPKQLGHLTAGKSGTDQQHSVQSVIIPGLPGPEDLLLQGDSHNVCVLDFQFLHIGLLSPGRIPERSDMRTYL
jgi:hypothetical protein